MISSEKRITAIVLAAGTGRRFKESGSSELKQLFPVDGQPILLRTCSLLVQNEMISEVKVVLNDLHEDVCRIKEILQVLPVKYVINYAAHTDNNLISFLLGVEEVSGPILVVESDCIFSNVDIDKMVQDLKRNEIRFANIGDINLFEQGGLLELDEQKNVKGLSILSQSEMKKYKDDYKYGYKLFGLASFGAKALDRYVKKCNELANTTNKYFLEVAMREFSVADITTVSMEHSSFSFNTLVEFENGKSHTL